MTNSNGSTRPHQIRNLKQQGLSNRQIAIRLEITRETVRTSQAKSLAKRLDGPLTEKERQVADLVAGGLSSGEIAAKLQISKRTVHSHRYRLSRKLSARNAADIAKVTNDS